MACGYCMLLSFKFILVIITCLFSYFLCVNHANSVILSQAQLK